MKRPYFVVAPPYTAAEWRMGHRIGLALWIFSALGVAFLIWLATR